MKYFLYTMLILIFTIGCNSPEEIKIKVLEEADRSVLLNAKVVYDGKKTAEVGKDSLIKINVGENEKIIVSCDGYLPSVFTVNENSKVYTVLMKEEN